MALMSAVILIGVIALLASFATIMMTSSFHATSSLNLDADRSDISNMLTGAVDCRQTLQSFAPPTTCTSALALYNAAGQVIVPATVDGAKIGRWNVRARCSASGINVQAAILAPGSPTGFGIDPLSKQALDWNNPHATIIPAATGLCASAFNPSLPKTIIFGGFLYRCPYYPGPGGAAVAASYSNARIDTSMPVNLYTGTHYCPPFFVPRISWNFFSADCGQNTYCSCGWVQAHPSQNACAVAHSLLGQSGGQGGSNNGIVGCGQLQYMCVRNSDGTPVAGDGTSYD